MRPDTSNQLPEWFWHFFPVFFIAYWCLICYAISWLSGWHALIRRFRATSEPYGDLRTAGPFFYTVYFRLLGHYGNVIRITAAEDALYLSVLFLFRIGHPPLRIPWNEIEFSRETYFFRSCVRLFCGREERISIRISERMARNLGILDRIENQDPLPALSAKL